MINDFVRNQFYDRVLAERVAGRRCTDIGFGTGLLSMIALKHGAAHIRAFESDWHRYHLGREIVGRLGLENRIDLINERYDHTMAATEITFSETVNGNLWWEGLWNSIPRHKETEFLPGTYFLEIWAQAVPDSFAQALCRPGQSQVYFAPGIDLDPKFVDTVNSFRAVTTETQLPLDTGIVSFARQQETDWGWIPYMRAVASGTIVASYAVSQGDDRELIELTADLSPWSDHTVLLVPRMGMQHSQHRLYLDTGHWGPAENPVLAVKPHAPVTVSHSVLNGNLTYNMN